MKFVKLTMGDWTGSVKNKYFFKDHLLNLDSRKLLFSKLDKKLSLLKTCKLFCIVQYHFFYLLVFVTYKQLKL